MRPDMAGFSDRSLAIEPTGVRKMFDQIVWVTLGQTPTMEV